MLIESYYNDLTKYAKGLYITDKSIDPLDVVNDAFLWAIENNVTSKEDIKKRIKGILYNAKSETQSINKYETTRICCKCHEELPIAMFYVDKRKRKVETRCLTCLQEYHKNHYRLSKENNGIEFNAAKRLTFLRWVAKNRRKWNSYLSEKYIESKNNLTDTYIKKLLRRPGRIITAQMIEEKRNSMLRKKAA